MHYVYRCIHIIFKEIYIKQMLSIEVHLSAFSACDMLAYRFL